MGFHPKPRQGFASLHPSSAISSRLHDEIAVRESRGHKPFGGGVEAEPLLGASVIWWTCFPRIELGEQIIVSGLDVNTLQAGDLIHLGGAIAKINKPRTSCAKFKPVQGHDPAEAAGRLGVMANVIDSGSSAVGDPVRALEQSLILVQIMCDNKNVSPISGRETDGLQIDAGAVVGH